MNKHIAEIAKSATHNAAHLAMDLTLLSGSFAADLPVELFKHANVAAAVATRPRVGCGALQPAQHLLGVRVATRCSPRIDKSKWFNAVGDPAPRDPIVG